MEACGNPFVLLISKYLLRRGFSVSFEYLLIIATLVMSMQADSKNSIKIHSFTVTDLLNKESFLPCAPTFEVVACSFHDDIYRLVIQDIFSHVLIATVSSEPNI